MLNLYEGNGYGSNSMKNHFTVASISRVCVSDKGEPVVHFNDGYWVTVDETTRNQILKEMQEQG